MKKRKVQDADVMDEIKQTSAKEYLQIIAHCLLENNRLNEIIK